MKHIATAPPAYRSRRRRRRSLAAYGFPYPPTARTITRQGSTRTDAYTYNNRSESPRRLVGGLDKPRSAFAPRGRAGNGVPASQLISDIVDGTGLNGWDYDLAAAASSSGVASKRQLSPNRLNQYTAIEEAEGTFTPTYDADGNQTRVKTSTGIWNVTYKAPEGPEGDWTNREACLPRRGEQAMGCLRVNAKNRPILFTKDDNSVSVECTYDYMGRRATKKVTENGIVTLHQRYLYRGYLQIACCDLLRPAHPCIWLITWDPTQPIATRPLAIQKDGTWYTYGLDLTKNVCEVYSIDGYIRTNYTYTPYGVNSIIGNVFQPVQWSSEFFDNELGLVYYNWRYYNPIIGRWTTRDFKVQEVISPNTYGYIHNATIYSFDILGKDIYHILDREGAIIFGHSLFIIGNDSYGYRIYSYNPNHQVQPNEFCDGGCGLYSQSIWPASQKKYATYKQAFEALKRYEIARAKNNVRTSDDSEDYAKNERTYEGQKWKTTYQEDLRAIQVADYYHEQSYKILGHNCYILGCRVLSDLNARAGRIKYPITRRCMQPKNAFDSNNKRKFAIPIDPETGQPLN